jgi:hypothetical protein
MSPPCVSDSFKSLFKAHSSDARDFCEVASEKGEVTPSLLPPAGSETVAAALTASSFDVVLCCAAEAI